MKPINLLAQIAILEEQLKAAPPAEAGKLAKKIVTLKDDWLNQ